MNWNFTHGDGSVRDVIYWPELTSLDEFHRVRGGNPILFPFCGRTFDRGEIDHWCASDNVQRPMPQHGIARQGRFKLVRLDARGFAAQLEPDAAAQAAYPYDYEFTVTYRFESLSLSCEFALKNLGRISIPWSAGHHFYFTLPWTEGATRNDYSIRIPASERFKQNSAGELISAPQLNAEENAANPALLDTLHSHLRSSEARITENGKAGSVVIRLGTTPVPTRDTTFVTWTAAEQSPFYCVEPWMGPPNAPEHKHGLEWVRPGETRTFSVSVAAR